MNWSIALHRDATPTKQFEDCDTYQMGKLKADLTVSIPGWFAVFLLRVSRRLR